MTMSVVDNIMTANLQNKENAELNEPSAVAIGTEFARQYYTLLADNPKSVHKFYSHESTLQMNDISAVGQEKIGRAIENLVGSDKWRIKIVSIKGNMTLNQGIALQVFGEISGTDSKRRFVQTFILGPQGLKKYYVQHDFFYFIDEIFALSKDSPSPTMSTPTPVTIEKTVPATPTVNGHKQAEVSSKSEVSPPPAPVPAPQPVVEQPKPVVTEVAPAAPPAPTEERPSSKRQPRKEEKKKEEPAKQEAVPPAPAPAPVDNTPKTWAKMVGASSKATVTTVTPPVAATPQSKPAQPKAALPAQKPVTPKQPQPNGAPPHTANKATIHVAGIVRTSLPDSTSTAESEIKQVFSKWGAVENVTFPRAALDQRDVTKPTFAFIQMKSIDGVKAVLEAAEKTERGALHLNIQVPSFGFDGEVTVSEQRERPPFVHRGGRGFRGRGGRGGSYRGGYNNNSNGQH